MSLLLLPLLAGLCLTGDINIVFGKTELTVSSTYFEQIKIRYSDIISIEQYDSCDMGIRLFGAGTPQICTGIYSNRRFGRYRRYMYSDCDTFIAIHTADSVTAINLETRKETLQFYKALCETFK